ncbi:hypothetical protein V8E54_008395 [Elaphomyces granulatus]
MGGGRAFDIDAFLEFMPGQEGEAWEKREEHHPSVLPLSTAPPGRANLSIPSEKVFFLSSSSSLHSNGNYLHILHDNVAQIMREQDSRKRLQSHREESPHSMIGRHSQGVTAKYHNHVTWHFADREESRESRRKRFSERPGRKHEKAGLEEP